MSGRQCSHPARTALRSAVGACVDVGAPRAWCATLLKYLGPGSEKISPPRPTTTKFAPPAAGVAVRFQFLLVLRGHSRMRPEVNHTAEPFGFTIPGGYRVLGSSRCGNAVLPSALPQQHPGIALADCFVRSAERNARSYCYQICVNNARIKIRF